MNRTTTMHKALLMGWMILILAGMSSMLCAQDMSPWQFVRHSAVDNSNQVHVRFDGTPDMVGAYEMYNWSNNAWQPVTLNTTDDVTYEGLLNHTTGQPLKWRFRTAYDYMGEETVIMNPAYLNADSFPPALAAMAYVGADPVGDSLSIYAPNLDITGTWFAATDNRLYMAISNQANAFPTMNSFTSYNLYFAGLLNPQTVMQDSTIYAMVYTFNIQGVISPGLYKLGYDGTTPTFQRLGNVQSQVVGGKLLLSCAISDLTADPAFGTWPPEFNMLGSMAGTVKIDIDLSTMTPTFNFGDYSTMAEMIFTKYEYAPTVNNLPVLSDVQYSNGLLSFNYADANHDFPLYAKAILNNGEEYDVSFALPDFTAAAQGTASLPIIGWTSGTLRVSDNNTDFVEANINYTAVQDEVQPVLSMQAMPNPFNPSAGALHISLAGNASKQPAKLSVYNLKGECVRQLTATDGLSYTWDGRTDAHTPAASGIYYLKLSGAHPVTQKIIVIR